MTVKLMVREAGEIEDGFILIFEGAAMSVESLFFNFQYKDSDPMTPKLDQEVFKCNNSKNHEEVLKCRQIHSKY